MNPDATPGFHILYVDDEAISLRYFRQIFEEQYVIHTADNAADAYRILEHYGPRIGVLITDQRMPGESGVALLERARRLNPNIVRILVTAYTDYAAAVSAVNQGPPEPGQPRRGAGGGHGGLPVRAEQGTSAQRQGG